MRWCLGERKNHDLFASKSADVVVQTEGFDAGDVLNQCIQCRSCYFDKLRPNLLQQVAPFLRREGLHQMLLGSRQDALQANHEQIINQMCVDVLGPPAHVLLLEMRHRFANRGFDLSLCFHTRFPFRPTKHRDDSKVDDKTCGSTHDTRRPTSLILK